MKFRNIFYSLLALPILLQGSIQETPKFDDVLQHIEKVSSSDILVVCDIDNTLIEAAQQFGSVAWGEYVIQKLEKKGVPRKQAEEIESRLWGSVQAHIKVKPVDANTPKTIEKIQDSKIPVIGLTLRTPKDAASTHKQLKSVGIDLSKRAPASDQELPLKVKALYDHGILFSSPFNKKSHVLTAFLEKNNLHPKYIIYIDDKQSHLEDVEKALESKGITCIGLRFSAADKQAQEFNADIAEAQWKSFPNVPSDEEALSSLHRG